MSNSAERGAVDTDASSPEVSVVMGVYNDAHWLRASLGSVLAQAGVSLEVVVVDDGSTDETPGVLAELSARDVRLVVVCQEHGGLTAALITACERARGQFLARHDADDEMLPDRLRSQVELMRSNPLLSCVSCGWRSVGPRGEPLDEMIPRGSPAELTRGLRVNRRGVPHITLMFRRAAYRRVGGYRRCFAYAQDVDLAFRLTEVGLLGAVPRILEQMRINERGISVDRQQGQRRLADLAVAAAEARCAGKTEERLLAQAWEVSEAIRAQASPGTANVAYFLGRSLLSRRDPRCLPYVWKAVRRAPWDPRAWVTLGQALWLRVRA